MDTLGVEAVRPYVERAAPSHPSLIDAAHVTGELFGFVNVAAAVWIDEDGMIVRHAHTPALRRAEISEPTDDMPPAIQEMLRTAKRIRISDPDGYRAALLDWVDKGAASEHALSADEVVRRSAARPAAHAEAAACFEIGQHLQRQGHGDDAVAWFKRAHAGHPENWTYKRQAWSIIDPVLQDPGETYGTSWAAELARSGPEQYYVLFEES